MKKPIPEVFLAYSTSLINPELSLHPNVKSRRFMPELCRATVFAAIEADPHIQLFEANFPRDENVPLQQIPQEFIRRLGDPDAASRTDPASTVIILANPQATGRAGEIASVVASPRDAEGLAELSWPVGESHLIFGAVDFDSASFSHFFDAGQRFQCAE
jgi:hypothetical protein